ncbi:monocarboxylate transporter 14-like [Glossina fuscipes]|uniref:Monocarboxylate transporter 14-like n=1 Tax=Glossina fuscipes TaxID=7396 RepID=A0A9C5ZKH8_9MUSC|nr:monocarboxylate transporter 14-like [Glossina fuscipes]
MQMPGCLCNKIYHQQQQHPTAVNLIATPAPPTAVSTVPALSRTPQRQCNHAFYYAPEHCMLQYEEQDSGFPGLRDQEFYLLHRNIPALRRTGIDTTGIRQHYYPDGGWGWIICGMSFLVHLLTTGLQLSYGLTLFYALTHIHNSSGNEWLGALSWSISMVLTPFIDVLSRRKSTRLLAVVGGLIMSLGILFTSFATEVDQMIFSYGKK